jgi:hypothetical protein
VIRFSGLRRHSTDRLARADGYQDGEFKRKTDYTPSSPRKRLNEGRNVVNMHRGMMANRSHLALLRQELIEMPAPSGGFSPTRSPFAFAQCRTASIRPRRQ